MARLRDLEPVLALVEWFLGWTACLPLAVSCRHAIHPDTRLRMHTYLRRFGFAVTAESPPDFSREARVLAALVLAPLQRLQTRFRLNDPWAVERKVWVRHTGFASWRCHHGTQIGAAMLDDRLFPYPGFEPAMPLLRMHGQGFELYRNSIQHRDIHQDVTSLYCVLCGFEIVLRMTRQVFDEDVASSWSSGGS